MSIKIGIADDNHFLLRAIQEKVSFFSDVSVRFTATNGSDCVSKLEAGPNIDLVLMDIEMPYMNGIEATSIIKARFPHIKIIMLTVFDNDENIFNSIKAGADGYLLKEVNPKELHQGILDTLSGGAAMNPSIALKTLKLLRNPVDFDSRVVNDIKLSGREIEVLEQLSKG
ncbi:MAG: response regulator transcription factor, partial [Chitinophagaceae bacterium]